MTPDAIAELFRAHGLAVGGYALLIAAVVYLHKGWAGCQEARIADAKLGVDALARQASTNAEMAAALRELREGQAEIMRVLTVLPHQLDGG